MLAFRSAAHVVAVFAAVTLGGCVVDKRPLDPSPLRDPVRPQHRTQGVSGWFTPNDAGTWTPFHRLETGLVAFVQAGAWRYHQQIDSCDDLVWGKALVDGKRPELLDGALCDGREYQLVQTAAGVEVQRIGIGTVLARWPLVTMPVAPPP